MEKYAYGIFQRIHLKRNYKDMIKEFIHWLGQNIHK